MTQPTHVPAPIGGNWLSRILRVQYRRHFRDRRRERLFLASVSFFIAFGITRLFTHAMRRRGPDAWAVFLGGVHVHHLVWGILLLLLVGYVWLLEGGTDSRRISPRIERTLAILYGAGAALTLDEFALWLHLEDVYWERQGRASIDAVVLFGGLVSVGLWGGPFLRATVRQVGRLIRRQVTREPRHRA
jgi:hypothetical protein